MILLRHVATLTIAASGLALSGSHRASQTSEHSGFLRATGIFIALASFLLRSYTPLNVTLAMTLALLFMIKSVVEERVLRVDAEYAAYLQRVRWRWFPGIA